MRRVLRKIRNHWLWAKPGHYLSPIPGRTDVDRQVAWDRHADLPGIDLREREQVERTQSLHLRRGGWDRYRPDQQMFGEADAILYRALLEQESPGKIIEIGSGWSPPSPWTSGTPSPASSLTQSAYQRPHAPATR